MSNDYGLPFEVGDCEVHFLHVLAILEYDLNFLRDGSIIVSPQSTESPASLDRPIGAIFECLIGSKRPVYTSQLQYSVKVATSSYTVQSKYVLVYPGSYM